MAENKLPSGVGKKIVQALKKQAEIEIQPVSDNIEDNNLIQDIKNNSPEFYSNEISDNVNLDETTCNLIPAEFVADKLSEQKDKIWNEFLRLIGIANQSFQKKERNIRDEIFISQAGTIASRYARFESRKMAIEKTSTMTNNITTIFFLFFIVSLLLPLYNIF